MCVVVRCLVCVVNYVLCCVVLRCVALCCWCVVGCLCSRSFVVVVVGSCLLCACLVVCMLVMCCLFVVGGVIV